MIWNVLTWVVVGGLAGWVASKIMKTDAEQGAIGNIIIGILGAVIGGVIITAIGGRGFSGFNLWSFLVALLGSVILLYLIKYFRGRR